MQKPLKGGKYMGVVTIYTINQVFRVKRYQNIPRRNWVEIENVNSNRYKLDSSISSKGKLL
jgi:hypothetical protein